MKFTIDTDFETQNDLQKYIGKVFPTKNNGDFMILGVINRTGGYGGGDITYLIRFIDTGYLTDVSRAAFQKGDVKDKLLPIINGVGYMGYIELDSPIKKNLHQVWNGMLERCYGEDKALKAPSYQDCSVDERWFNFSNFYEDVLQIPHARFKIEIEKRKSKTQFEITNEGENVNCFIDLKLESEIDFINEITNFTWELDKDILKHDTKIYSKDTCCWIPGQLNSFFTNKNSKNTSGFEGVAIDITAKEEFKYQAHIRWDGKLTRLGRFDNPIDAYKSYVKSKSELLEYYLNEKFWYIDEDIKKAMRKKLKLQVKETLEANGCAEDLLSKSQNFTERRIFNRANININPDYIIEIINKRKLEALDELESDDENRLKLNESKVKEIKTLLKHSNLTQDEIGELYNVTRNNISYIANERRWAKVTI